MGRLYEIYRPCKKHRGISTQLLEINDRNVTNLKPDFIWNRRQNLTGCELTSAYVNTENEMYEIKPRRNCTNSIRGDNKIICLADRWHLSIGKTLLKDLNLTIRFINPMDNEYGVKIKSEWTGVIGLLEQRKADVSFSLLSFTPSRARAIEFSISLGFSSIRMYIAKPKHAHNFISFYNIYS